RRSIDSVIGAASLFAPFSPGALIGESLERFPYLRERLEHLRIVEIRDTAHPRRELKAEAQYFASHRIGALLVVRFAIRDRIAGCIALCSNQPRESWDANLHLMLKLLGTSYACGLERLQYRAHFADVAERNELALYGSNDGLWDFDHEHGTVYFSPR